MNHISVTYNFKKARDFFSVYQFFNYWFFALNYIETVFWCKYKSMGNLPVETIFQNFLPQNNFRTSGPYAYKHEKNFF